MSGIGQETMKATDPKELERNITDPRIPKSEREWWAHRELARLREELAREKRILKCDLMSCRYVGECADFHKENKNLREELEKAKEENRYLLVEAKAELEWFQRSWCDDHPMSEGGINRVHRLISRIDVALKEAGI